MFSKRVLLLSLSAAVAAAPAPSAPYKHVLAFSVDGMHASDLDKYVALKPGSSFASLLATGIDYTNAYTSGPSDSFPGTMAQFTGGSPRTTGVWYDDLWDWTWYPAGSNCTGPVGTEVAYDESIDYNDTMLFSGGIDPDNLPMAIVNGKCLPRYPHDRLLVNTVFEIVHGAGYQTAYVDKHPAYDIVRGPSGTGLTVGYFPEIAAVASDLATNIGYDSLHVQAWLNFINGVTPVNSTGALSTPSMPTLMGGNFQSVNVAQKAYGYNNDSTNSLSTGILQAFDFVDTSLGQIVTALNKTSNLDSTLIVVCSKHGQAPINPHTLHKIPASHIEDSIGVPYAFVTTDDIALIWLNHTSDIPTAAANLQKNATALGIQEVIYGQNLIAQGFGDPLTSPRVPHIIVRVVQGVIYTSASKLEEHGGLNEDDRHITCFVSNPKLKKQTVSEYVSTRQVAPTILEALGLDAGKLQAVQAEGTKSLPGLNLGYGGWGDWSG